MMDYIVKWYSVIAYDECASLGMFWILALIIASVIHVDVLCLYVLNFTVLYTICFSLASLITSCNML